MNKFKLLINTFCLLVIFNFTNLAHAQAPIPVPTGILSSSGHWFRPIANIVRTSAASRKGAVPKPRAGHATIKNCRKIRPKHHTPNAKGGSRSTPFGNFRTKYIQFKRNKNIYTRNSPSNSSLRNGSYFSYFFELNSFLFSYLVPYQDYTNSKKVLSHGGDTVLKIINLDLVKDDEISIDALSLIYYNSLFYQEQDYLVISYYEKQAIFENDLYRYLNIKDGVVDFNSASHVQSLLRHNNIIDEDAEINSEIGIYIVPVEIPSEIVENVQSDTDECRDDAIIFHSEVYKFNINEKIHSFSFLMIIDQGNGTEYIYTLDELDQINWKKFIK